jgi:diacylglycerol kinase family enzyme
MSKFDLTWISNQVKKESTKEVNFASLTKIEKIAYLETLVNTAGAKKTFKKSVKVANLSKDKKFELIAMFAGLGNLEAVAAIANDDKDFETEMDVVISYDKMSDSQKLDFLRCENPVEDDTKVKVEIFGGENIVEVLKAVRGLSDEDFNALITK